MDHETSRQTHGQNLRQIALLLHSLPERTHRVLVGQLAERERRAVADELMVIGEVDALEQYRVLRRMRSELLAETESVERVESEIHDEIQIGRARVKSKSPKSFRAKTTLATKDPTASPDDGLGQTNQAIRLRVEQTQAAGVLSGPFPKRQGVNMQADHLPPSSADAGAPVILRHPASTSDEEELAERIDEYLVGLTPQRLCAVLGQASTKQAFLVLCGLPNDVAEAALALLPRKQARQVRSRMRQIGRLQLSEIDQAKRELVAIAMRGDSGPIAVAA
ncbi:MAG: FliG C-terminal domain-containing protein [Planctomycetota bacterium]